MAADDVATGRCVAPPGRARPDPRPSWPVPRLALACRVGRLRRCRSRGPLDRSHADRAGPGGRRLGRPWARPPWLAGEYLALLEAQGRGVGVIYLLHFDRPMGDVANPRGFAEPLPGWTHDLPARLVDHAAGRGARLMQVVGEAGIGWQLARIWTGTRTRERSLKRSGGAARRCPVCQLAALGLQPPRPVDPLALELGDRVAAFARPAS